MAVNQDFSDLFAAFAAAEVRYLVVGAHAVTFHAAPRFTKDLDVWVDPAPDNAARVYEALQRFGAPLAGTTPADFGNEDLVFQIGVAPNRVDVLMGLAGVEFAAAWERRVVWTYGDHPIYVISRADLIANKRTVDRPQDREDVRLLEEHGGED